MSLLLVEELTVVYRPFDSGPRVRRWPFAQDRPERAKRVEGRSDHAEPVTAVDRVSLAIEPGEIVGVVGESGCGKSTLALAITNLLPPQGTIQSGRVLFQGHELRMRDEEALRAIRGHRISYVFQDPATSLNPVLPVRQQLDEALPISFASREAREAHAVELLTRVGISSPQARLASYPHELSGGMQQRVMIAMAIASNPALLIADEPTTALDVTVQVQILQLLKALQARLNLAILLISHDLLVVERLCHRVAIMSAGRLVEHGPVRQVLEHPSHPATQQLLAARPSAAIRSPAS